jgi:hypothetical protein
LKGLKSTATGASAASGPLGLPHCVGSRYFPHRFPVNQQRHPGRGFTDSSENDIRAKTASDASSLARAQEILGHEEASTTARHYRRGVAKVAPLR